MEACLKLLNIYMTHIFIVNKGEIVLSRSLLKDEDALNESEADIILKELAEVRRDFSLAKEKLYRRTQSYFNQSVASNYTKEEVLHELINECEALKKRYRFLQEKKLLREFSQ